MNILDVSDRAGLALRKMANTRGGEYRSHCPYCGGDPGSSDRFLVWPAENGGDGMFWCRQCKEGGDIIKLMVDKCGYSYPEAFQAVGREMPANYRPVQYRPVDSPSRSDSFIPRTCEGPVETWQAKADAFVTAAHQALLENKTQLDYLAGRGLDLQAVRGYRLGWFGGENGKPCMFRPRKSWGLPTIKNEKTGKNKMLWVPRGIVIPKFSSGSVHRIRIRRPDEDIKTDKDVRYYVVPGSGQEVMGYNPTRQAFVVTEAELDGLMVARHAGSLVGTVGLGSAGIKPDASAYYVLKKAMRILVALDYDQAGKAARAWWLENFDTARFWPVPVGKDPGEAFQKGLDIKEWVRRGLPPALTLDVNRGYRIPDGMSHMEELQMLLSKYPVTIEATQETGQVHFDPGFRHRGIRQRICDLFYKDEEIYWYLRMYHPADVITGENYFVKKECCQ